MIRFPHRTPLRKMQPLATAALTLLCLLAPLAAHAADEDPDTARITASGDVLKELLDSPSGISHDLLNKAYCVIVLPSVKKGGFIVAAQYGRGIMTCRSGDNFDGAWSAPIMMQSTGGSVGFQIGGQAVDLVMLIMNKDGMKHLLSSEFALGADASVAAGPVGRHAEGNTDWKMRAEVLTYSRARGLFAGVSLNGAQIKQDKDSTREFYGRMVPFRTSLIGEIDPPAGANAFLTALAQWAQEAAK